MSTTTESKPTKLPSAEVLMARAVEETGLSDFGAGLVEALSRYLHAYETEGNLGEAGVIGVQYEAHGLLVNRLRYLADIKRCPEILDEHLPDPIVITGLPRTGTTKLARMMSRDPGLQSPTYWRILNPAPLPEAEPGGRDPRIAVAEEIARAIRETQPDLFAMHAALPHEAEEDLLLANLTFESVSNAMHLFDFNDYLAERPKRSVYEFGRGLLQYLQWQDGGRRDRPWVLKAPLHLDQLDVIAELYPQSTFVHCHRDPVLVMASTCRLYELVARSRSEDIDLTDLGTWALRTWKRRMEKSLQQRDALGNALRIIDADYRAIKDDPFGVIATVYDAHGIALSDAARQHMTTFDEENPQHKFGRADYSLERYGLSDTQVEEAFEPYRSRFSMARR